MTSSARRLAQVCALSFGGIAYMCFLLSAYWASALAFMAGGLMVLAIRD